MAFREVTMLEVTELVRMWLSRLSKKQIARQLGLDVKTVRRYVKAAGECGLKQEQGPAALTEELTAPLMAKLEPGGGRPRGDGRSLCEKHRDFIGSRLKARVRLTKIRKLLRRQSVFVSYATLRRFAVLELGFSSHSPTLPVVDGEPGQELQLDTGWMGHLDPDLLGRRRRFRVFIFTAVRSRHRFVYPAFQETTERAIEACEAAWEFFSGIFRVLIVDNTKAIVDKADPSVPSSTVPFSSTRKSVAFSSTRPESVRLGIKRGSSVAYLPFGTTVSLENACSTSTKLVLTPGRGVSRTTGCAGTAPHRDYLWSTSRLKSDSYFSTLRRSRTTFPSGATPRSAATTSLRLPKPCTRFPRTSSAEN